jgi:hypothetical protein
MNFNMEQRINLNQMLKSPGREGRSGRIVAVRVQDH